jgi:hypothetical protein
MKGGKMKKSGDIIGEGVIGMLFLIVFVFNSFAGIVGGIWLLCLGHWSIVLGGFLASLSMPWWWPIVSLPSLGLGVLYSMYVGKNNIVGAVILCLIGGLYSSFLIIGWLVLVFTIFFITSLREDITLFPMLLAAYSVATSPFLYMARNEPQNSENLNLTMSIIVIGSILTVFLLLLGVPLIYPLILLGLSMILKTLFGVLRLPIKLKTYLTDTQRVSDQDIDIKEDVEYNH